MPEKSQYQLHIFDVDGLLLDTEDIYNQCFKQILNEQNSPLLFDHHFKKTIMGQREEAVAEILIQKGQLDLTVSEFRQRLHQLEKKHMPHCQPMPGAIDILNRLAQSNNLIAVATSSIRPVFDLKKTNHDNLFAEIETIVTGCMVQHGKPAPDIFLKAVQLAKPKLHPSSVLVFEDSPAGVLAAIRAGMDVVWIPDPKMHHDLNQFDQSITHPNQLTILDNLFQYII